MKKSIYSALLYIFIFVFVIQFFNGIVLPMDPIYWFVCVLGFAVAGLLHKPLLKFLTVRVNFITFLLSVGLLSVGTFYLLTLLLPGFFVSASTFEGFSYSALTIEPFDVSVFATKITASFLFATLCGMMNSLLKDTD